MGVKTREGGKVKVKVWRRATRMGGWEFAVEATLVPERTSEGKGGGGQSQGRESEREGGRRVGGVSEMRVWSMCK